MKRTAILLALAGICMSILAVPARRLSKDIVLNDGRIVRGAVFCGDEHFHYWESADGIRYVKTGENGYEAISDAKVKAAMRKAETEKAVMIGQVNLAPRGLVILANFKDVKFQQSNTQAAMDSMLNGNTYDYHYSIGSARRYFQDQSNGLYNPTFDIVGPVELPDSVHVYGRNTSSEDGSDRRAADMVLRACEEAAKIPSVDFSRYDNNNDGMVDMVFVIYAGYGEADSQIDNLIWPASWAMGAAISSGKTHLPPNSPRSMYTFGGKTIGHYAYTCELNYHNTITNPTPGYSETNPMRAGIGVFCHEFSHVIGLPDYYDTENGTNYTECLTPGSWDIMDLGNYNMDGFVPPNYSVHEKWWIGWQAPELLNNSANVCMHADSTSYYITRYGRPSIATGTDTIYYLENRQQTGWDAGLPGHGMYVLRVVYDNNAWNSNVPNNTARRPRYLHIAADGTYTWNDGDSGLQGDSGDTYPGRANVTNCTLFPRFPITGITEQDGVIRFTISDEGTTPPDTTVTAIDVIEASETIAVYNITGHFVGTTTNGLTRGLYIVQKNGHSEKLIIH